MAFFFDHTEGFDDFDVKDSNEDESAVIAEDGNSKQRKGRGVAESLKKRWLIIILLN